jgi:hypothetical protein
MFIGHFAVGFAAKRAAPSVSLGVLFLAAQLADLVWPNLVLLGIERVEIDPGNTAFTPLNFAFYPYSHSLTALIAWGAAAAVIYRLWRRGSIGGAVAVGLLVISHWVLDAISHRPDMPLTFSNATRVGLGLWYSVEATVVVEVLLLAVGLWLYLQATRPRDRIGSIGLWSLVAFLVLINIANIVGPPPPSARAVAWTVQAVWLLVIWAFWVDRHREATPQG